jgi:hypothetical protein
MSKNLNSKLKKEESYTYDQSKHGVERSTGALGHRGNRRRAGWWWQCLEGWMRLGAAGRRSERARCGTEPGGGGPNRSGGTSRWTGRCWAEVGGGGCSRAKASGAGSRWLGGASMQSGGVSRRLGRPG